ncbi:MAG: hypothetical protein SH808_01835 [Saprospiraceae bacterium]|nr:hypothetical protein [Saprospiraceae bacterium]
MEYTDLIVKVESGEIDAIEEMLFRLKNENKSLFRCYIDKLKVYFILNENIEIINKLSLIFSTLKIHSSVPLILSKLIDGKYDTEGGTLLFSLLGLKRTNFKDKLKEISKRDISFEMKSMLKMLL